MRKAIFISLILLCITPVFAQTSWPPIGAKWHYSYRPCDMGNCSGLIKEFIYFEAVSDTVINDTLCTKIVVEYHNDKKEVKYLGDEFFSTEGDKVFNYHHGRFNLLYDFSLQVGDSVTLTLGSNCNLYDQLESSGLYLEEPIPIKHYVTAKDSIAIGNKKYQYINMVYTTGEINPMVYPFFNNLIIKGIGSIEFLTGKLTTPIESGFYGNLRCYSDGIVNYTTDIPCEELTSAERITDNRNVYVYPNPVTTNSVICFPNPEQADVFISVSDMKGKVVWSTETCDEYSIIELGNLSNGIYTYRVYTKGEWIGSGKFAKSNNAPK